MNIPTKRITYTNGYSADIHPFGKKLNAEAARAVRKEKGLDVVLGALSMESALALSLASAKLCVFKLYAPGSLEPVADDRVKEILEDRDKFCEWIVTEATKFQQELDDAWGAEVKN